MKKRIESILLVIMILFIQISYTKISYASVSSVSTIPTISLTGSLEAFSGLSSSLSSSIPVGLSLTAFLKINNFVTLEGQKQAERDFEKLSEQDKAFYKNYINYWEVNQEYYNWTGTDAVIGQNVQELKYISKPYIEKVKDFYGKVNTQVQTLKSKLGLIVSDGVASSAGTIEELKEKLKSTNVNLQIDTSFINQSLDMTKTLDKTISDKYSITKELSQDTTKMTYTDLYYTFSSNQDRLKFLYNVCVSIDNFFDIAKNYDNSTAFPLKFAIFEPSKIVFYDSKYRSDYLNLNQFVINSKYMNYNGTLPWSTDLYIAPILFDFTVSDVGSNFSSSNIFSKEEILFLTSPYTIDYPFRFSYSYHNQKCILPRSLVIGYIETPFSTLDDVREFKRQYLGLTLPENRPINYKLTLENLQKGKLENLEPLTKEIVSYLPLINTTSFPLTDTNSLPTNEDIEKEKEKEKNGLSISGTKPNSGTLTGGIDGLETKEQVGEFLKSLVVPEQGFLEQTYQQISSQLPPSFNPDSYRQFFLKQRDELEVHYFDDYYIDIMGQHIKVVDMSPFRESLPKIKNYTDFFFWFLLVLYHYNELYFIIRGVKPLSSPSSKEVTNIFIKS